jgi:hypothetical protein
MSFNGSRSRFRDKEEKDRGKRGGRLGARRSEKLSKLGESATRLKPLINMIREGWDWRSPRIAYRQKG